jgi:hypothetical protein
VDRGLFGAYNDLRLNFFSPISSCDKRHRYSVKKYLADGFIDSLDFLALLSDAPMSSDCFDKFRSAISGISSSLRVEGHLLQLSLRQDT